MALNPPSPNSGQKSSENVSSSIKPDLSDGHSIELPFGIRQYSFLNSFNASNISLSICPDCDNKFIFSYAVISGAYNRAQQFANEYLEVATGRRALQDMTDFSINDYYPLTSSAYLGDGIPTLQKAERSLYRDVYSFTQSFVIDANGGSISTGINNIWYDSNPAFNNIAGFEHIRIAKNQLGGNREEGKIRFYNSEGRINANINFQSVDDANKFWKFYYTDVYNSTVKGIFLSYDRKNGTNYSERWK